MRPYTSLAQIYYALGESATKGRSQSVSLALSAFMIFLMALMDVSIVNNKYEEQTSSCVIEYASNGLRMAKKRKWRMVHQIHDKMLEKEEL